MKPIIIDPSKPTMTVDLDDCGVDTNGVSEKIAAKHGEVLDYSDFNYILRCSPVCAQEISNFLFLGDASCDPRIVPLTSPRFPEYMKWFMKYLNILYVTSRDLDKFEPTLRYLDFYDVPISRSNLAVIGPNGDKTNVMTMVNSILHIDDSATTIQKCIDRKINFCMMSNAKTGYNFRLRPLVGDKWVESFDELWLRRFEFLPILKQKVAHNESK